MSRADAGTVRSPVGSSWHRTGRWALGVTAAAILAGGCIAVPAAADPGYPSADQVRGAEQATASAAAEVGRIQVELATTASRVQQADEALSVAAEEYDTAQIELAESERAARLSGLAAQRASARLVDAQRDVGRLAAQTYREGGSLAGLEVVLSPSGPQDVLDRAQMMRTLGARRERTVQRMDGARVVATVLQRQATQAALAQREAARQLASAKLLAEARATSAHAAYVAATATQEQLVARLAVLRHTSVTLEHQRQEGLIAEKLAEEERARQEAERRERERRERERRDAAPPTSAEQPGNGGSGGSDDGSGAGGGSGGGSGDVSGGGSGDGGSGDGGSGDGGSGGGSGDTPGTPDSGGGPDVTPPGSSAGTAAGGRRAVDWARDQIGLPYQWGGAGPGSYDCSGLTMRAWERGGVALPHSSRMQYRQVRKISYGELRPGDLIFYANDPSDPGTIHHVTLYAGGGMMIEAPATGLNVRLVPLRRGAQAMPYAGRP